MYVKVAYGDPGGGDFLTEVHPPIHSGFAALPFDPQARDHDIGGELARQLGKALFVDDPEGNPQVMPLNTIHVLEIDPSQTKYEANQNLLVVRYVWWDEPGDGLHAVVTTQPIYILSESGKTIEKVR